MDFGGQSGPLKVRLPSPCTCRDGAEGRICTLGEVMEGRDGAFSAALDVGGAVRPGGLALVYTNSYRSRRHALGPAPRPAILLPQSASPLRGQNSPPVAGLGED